MANPCELIVALDVPGADDVRAVLDILPAEIRWYKVGLELFSAEGPPVLQVLHDRQKHIFLDLKLHDIPNTVAAAIQAIARHKVDLLTVHAAGGSAMLRAAAESTRRHAGPKLIAVTTLTSLSADDLQSVGIQRSISEQAQALGALSLESGIDGLVCSPLEAASLRATFGPESLLVTPGIRLAGDAVGDQKRIATPSEAARNGSNYIVAGRSLLHAKDPAQAALNLLADLRAG